MTTMFFKTFQRTKSHAFISVLLVSSAVLAGGQDGGGGGAVRCEKLADGRIEIRSEMIDGRLEFFKAPPPSALKNDRKFQILDLWEAQEGYGPFRRNKRTVPFDNVTPTAVQVQKAFERLDKVNPRFAKLVRDSHKIVTRKIEPVADEEYILPPIDTDVRYMPRGCMIVGFGTYWDTKEKLIYDPQVYDNVPLIDIAALEVHEAVYRVLRSSKFKDKTSWRARRITALMFAMESFTWDQALKGFPEDK